jgi:hypothetical protein
MRRLFVLIAVAMSLAVISTTVAAAVAAETGRPMGGRGSRADVSVRPISHINRVRNAVATRGFHTIARAIIRWSEKHNDIYPKAWRVVRCQLSRYVRAWPRNPWTHKPMHPGTHRGDYTYTRLWGGHGCNLHGHLFGTRSPASGSPIIVP